MDSPTLIVYGEGKFVEDVKRLRPDALVAGPIDFLPSDFNRMVNWFNRQNIKANTRCVFIMAWDLDEGSPLEIYTENVMGMMRLAKFFEHLYVEKFVMLSTPLMYDSDGIPVPKNYFETTKLLQEWILRMTIKRHLIIRVAPEDVFAEEILTIADSPDKVTTVTI